MSQRYAIYRLGDRLLCYVIVMYVKLFKRYRAMG